MKLTPDQTARLTSLVDAFQESVTNLQIIKNFFDLLPRYESVVFDYQLFVTTQRDLLLDFFEDITCEPTAPRDLETERVYSVDSGGITLSGSLSFIKREAYLKDSEVDLLERFEISEQHEYTNGLKQRVKITRLQ